VTPLAGKKSKLTWPEAKQFAHDVCLQMAQEAPDQFLVKMSKKLREGRIFLDYLRNDRTATAVAPLSPRARAGATVSMPITWREVKADLDPKKYTIRTVPALLQKTSAWADYCDGERPLEEAPLQAAFGLRSLEWGSARCRHGDGSCRARTATNSLKCGALSVATGTRDVSGTMVDNDVEIIWSGQGGPEVVAPTGPGGYGSKLVQRAVAFVFDRASRMVTKASWSSSSVGMR
jgi:LigD-like primase-polymerase